MGDPEFIRGEWDWDRDWPMSQMVRCGDYLWLTGQIAFDEQGQVVGPGDLKAQARQVFTNMSRVLGRVGCDLTSVIRLTSYFAVPMAGTDLTRKYWEVRHEFFGDHRPASTGFQVVSLLTPELMLEVDAVAYASGGKT